MPPAVETATDPAATENGTAKPLVGIIYPPPEIRNIVDKTASFVARNGFEFEARIRRNEQNNPKFNFLNPGDPYHAYYQSKVQDLKEGKPTEAPSAPPPPGRAPPPAPTTVPASVATQLKQQEILKQMQSETIQIPKEPPPDFEFTVEPPSISAMELDIVKLTAQFVARHGRQFLTRLMNQEARNYQFDFLRPQHSLFQYFTKLLEQYTKVLIPPKDLMPKLTEASTDPSFVLKEVKTRADWMRYQEAQRKREEEEAERERVSYAQIDWHDFVVVETVDYQPFEMGSFPPPCTPEEVGARVLLQERFEQGQEVEMQLDSEESSDEEEEAVKAPPPPPGAPSEAVQPPPTAPSADNVIIKKDYNPKAAPKPQARPPAPDEYLISPITGERIPASKVAEHMRIGLLDPRWLEERNRQVQEKMAQETVYAPGSSIESSLKALAERRTDIFGVGDEETAIGKKIGEEEKRKRDELLAKAAIETPPPPPPPEVREKPKDDKADHGVVVAAPPKPPQAPSHMPIVAPPMPASVVTAAPVIQPPQPPVLMMPIPQQAVPLPSPFMGIPQSMLSMGMGMMEEEPPAKRMRNEDNLMSEEAFLVRYPGLLHFTVAAPVYGEKPEWRLQGQQMNFSMHPTESVATVKQKISELTGMPPAKQKLYWEGLYFKDNYSLAFYNVLPEAVVQLQVKERGGRKK